MRLRFPLCGARVAGVTIFVLSLCRAAGAQGGEVGGARPVPPPAGPVSWVADPGAWEQLEEATVALADGTGLRIVSERRPIGKLVTDRGEVLVHQPRVRIAWYEEPAIFQIASIVPTGNRDLGLFAGAEFDDPVVPGEATEDPLGRWPNLCAISLYDASGTIDLDCDGIPEAALRKTCSCGGMGCSDMVFVTLDSARPRILDPSGLVRTIALRRVVVERIEPGEIPSRPILQVLPDFAEECRFIQAIGVRGASDCAECCRFPVLLRPIDNGAYEPYFDPRHHARLLRQAKEDLGYVAAGEPSQPMRSFEEAQVARAAAFFYLTGTGEATVSVILEGLGPRGKDHRAIQLATRIDRYFRPPSVRAIESDREVR